MSKLNDLLLKEDNDKAVKETNEYSCSLNNKSKKVYHNEINRKNESMQMKENKDIKSNFSSINNSNENSIEEEDNENDNIDNTEINHLEEIIFINIKASIDKDKLNYQRISLHTINLTYNKLIHLIREKFLIDKEIITLHSFYNREILDTSDLKYLELSKERNKIVFFYYSNHENGVNTNTIDSLVLKCFKFLKKIGEGGFGKVYLAEQRFSKEKYAIKTLKAKAKLDTKYFYKEIEALRKLEHKNIIKLITYCFNSKEKITLILEYGRGGTLLAQISQRKKLSENHAKRIFLQLLDALNYCHQNHIIHRDLKPENILYLDEEKTIIKIIDFGVAGIFQNEINKAGSVSYMAPEVIGGWNFESNPKIDIFALGCILYEMLCGEKLFSGGNFEEKKDKILKGKLVLSHSISPEAANLINSMIKVKADERISLSYCFTHYWCEGRKLSKDEVERDELVELRFTSKALGLDFNIEKLPNVKIDAMKKKENYNNEDKNNDITLKMKIEEDKELNYNNNSDGDGIVKEDLDMFGISTKLKKKTYGGNKSKNISSFNTNNLSNVKEVKENIENKFLNSNKLFSPQITNKSFSTKVTTSTTTTNTNTNNIDLETIRKLYHISKTLNKPINEKLLNSETFKTALNSIKNTTNTNNIKDKLSSLFNTFSSLSYDSNSNNNIINNSINNKLNSDNTLNINSNYSNYTNFDFNSYLKGSRGPKSCNKNKSSYNLPKQGLISKVSNDKELNIYQINYNILKSNNGKIASYLQPIGFTKKQKQQSERIKDMLLKNSPQLISNISKAKSSVFTESSNIGKVKENDNLDIGKSKSGRVRNISNREIKGGIGYNSNIEDVDSKDTKNNKVAFKRETGENKYNLGTKEVYDINEEDDNLYFNTTNKNDKHDKYVISSNLFSNNNNNSNYKLNINGLSTSKNTDLNGINNISNNINISSNHILSKSPRQHHISLEEIKSNENSKTIEYNNDVSNNNIDKKYNNIDINSSNIKTHSIKITNTKNIGYSNISNLSGGFTTTNRNRTNYKLSINSNDNEIIKKNNITSKSSISNVKCNIPKFDSKRSLIHKKTESMNYCTNKNESNEKENSDSNSNNNSNKYLKQYSGEVLNFSKSKYFHKTAVEDKRFSKNISSIEKLRKSKYVIDCSNSINKSKSQQNSKNLLPQIYNTSNNSGNTSNSKLKDRSCSDNNNQIDTKYKSCVNANKNEYAISTSTKTKIISAGKVRFKLNSSNNNNN